MKAVGYYESLAIDDECSLIDLEMAPPQIGSHDLLVEVRAVSVNPIDIKTRMAFTPPAGEPRILGFDAAGIVRDKGEAVTGFAVGDGVFYAGTLNRQGSNAAFQAVDYRLVAHKPKNLDFAASAALPLTALTAWEMLFDRLALDQYTETSCDKKSVLLMVGAAGGVGSISIQLVRQLSSSTIIIATASREESRGWVQKMGAHHVIDYRQNMPAQIHDLGFDFVDFIFSTADSERYRLDYVDMIAPQGRIGLIDGPLSFDIVPFKPKSVSLHWESMFTRSLFATYDMVRQGEILREIARLIDTGKLQPTLTQTLQPFNAATLRAAHRQIESGTTLGKIVVTYL